MKFDISRSYNRWTLELSDGSMSASVVLDSGDMTDLIDQLAEEFHGDSYGALQDRISELKDENASLQEALDDTKDRLDRYE